ncbi:MAG: hypothetical protein PQJ59_15415 [Spirochaetales bacterium]|nr:hypothetical protein [Spirochaetales bacterium]
MKFKFVLIIFFSFTYFLFAQEENSSPSPSEYREVEGLEQWSYTFDVSGLKKGTYNVIIRGTDNTGNISYSSPLNIQVDPDSDLPVSHIANPEPEMRVGGDLNIVGTCVDDDDVDFVEIKIDEGEYIRAEGSHFWSYFLDTSDMEDGFYTITSRGTDIYGVAGLESSLSFHLDRKTPVNSVNNYENGALVHGKIEFVGTVEDNNGIRELSYSLDGENYEPVKLAINKKDHFAEFKISLDTRETEDGPQILWLKSRDNMGSEGISAFLFFLDNRAPEITILDPLPEEEGLNGKFTLSGSLYDEIGISELSWEAGEDTGVIELIPGNPYWNQDFDFTGQKKAKILLTATDVTGNISTLIVERELNLEADLPTVTVRTPAEGDIRDSLLVEGFVFDDDAPASLSYSLDKGEAIVMETRGPFSFELPAELNPGEHTISLSATDENGLVGPPSIVNFSYSGEAPQISFLNVLTYEGESTPYYPGMELLPPTHKEVTGVIDFTNPPAGARIVIPGGEEIPVDLKKADEEGRVPFVIPVDKLPAGFVPVEVKAEDAYGKEKGAEAYLSLLDYSRIIGEDGIYLPEGNSFVLDGKTPLQGRVISRDLTELTVEGARETVFDVRLKEGQFTVTPLTSGIFRGVTLVAQDSLGNTYRSPAIDISSDLQPPRIDKLKAELTGSSYRVSGLIEEDCVLALSRLLIEEKEFDINPDEKGEFSLEIPLSQLPAGVAMAEVQAEDLKGNSAFSYLPLYNTSSYTPDPEGKEPAPLISITWPRAEAELFEGEGLAFSGEIENLSGSATLSATVDGEVVDVNLKGNGFVLPLEGLDVGVHKVVLSGTTEEGKSIKAASLGFTIQKAVSEIAWGEVEVAGEREVFSQSIAFFKEEGNRLYLTIGEDSLYSDLALRINGAIDVPVERDRETDESFITLPEDLPYMENSLTMTFKDYRGEERRLTGQFFLLHRKDIAPLENTPTLRLAGVDLSLDGKLHLAPGERLDGYFIGRPLESVESSSELLDVTRKGQELSLESLKAGKSENVVIKAVTVDGEEFSLGPFMLISDNSAPGITTNVVQSPWWLQDIIPLEGTLTDDLDITSFSYSIDESDHETPIAYVRDDETGHYRFSENLDISGLEEGPHRVTLKAKDEMGNLGNFLFSIVKDTKAPELVQLTPVADDGVNGKILFSVKGVDERGTDKMEFSPDGVNYQTLDNPSVDGVVIDFTQPDLDLEMMNFRVSDRSGNQTVLHPLSLLDWEGDKPRVMIQLPVEERVVRTDFVVSGMVLDDDGVKEIYWRIDQGEFYYLEGSNNFEIPFLLDNITDNEHTVEVKAVDLWGTESDVASLTFMVSKAAPVSKLLSPSIEETNRGVIRVSGESWDANGISEVYVSQDNGNTFNRAVGQENWYYDIQSEYLQDGTHSLLILAVDNTELGGLYSSLINVDNRAPEIELTNTDDGEKTPGKLDIIGRAWDGVALESLEARISPIEVFTSTEEAGPLEGIVQSLSTEGPFQEAFDLSSLPTGWYNLKITAVDKADNRSYLSRNFEKIDEEADKYIDITFPLEGEQVNRVLTIQGRVIGTPLPEKVNLYINGQASATVKVKSNGFFSYTLPEEETLPSGDMTLSAKAIFPGGESAASGERTISYSPDGPWIGIDNYLAGDFLRDRPWIQGQAGYVIPQEELAALADDKKAIKALEDSKAIEEILISLDNGRSFEKTGFSKGEWKYRIETGLMADGPLPVLVSARFADGSTAVAKTYLVIDETRPEIHTLTPEEGMLFNDSIVIEGNASDLYGLEDVSVALRQGDKSRYQVPSFIQGLYLDFHAFGATNFEVGAGLTFFDDNVKIQGSYGQAPAGRFDGDVYSIKLLANIAVLPFGYYLGPDWDFYSMSLAVGADFSYFTMTGSDHDDEGALTLGALLGQWEFARITTNWKTFNSFGFYVEGQLWFISSDVEGGMSPKIAFGVRTDIF